MLISSVTVSNYRSIGEGVVLRLEKGMTALVGPNGSGKSNLADAFRFVADSLRIGLEAAITSRHGMAAIRRWSGGRPFDIAFNFEVESGGDNDYHLGSYEFQLSGASAGDYRVKREAAQWGAYPLAHRPRFEVIDGKWKEGPSDIRPQVDPLGLALPLIAADDRFRPLADALRNIAIYSIFPDTLREPQKPDPTRPMDEHGSNWCSVLKDLRKEASSADLKAALGQITGDIDDIRVRQVGGYLVTEFRHGEVARPGGGARGRWFESALESDGTLRMAGILTALLQEPRPTLVGIEEPELTVHPGAIPLLYDFLSEASSHSQILLTTHSPDLLSLLEADQVRVVERRDGVTSIGSMEESQREAVRDRLFTPGDLLRMEGLRQG